MNIETIRETRKDGGAYANWHAVIIDAVPDVPGFILERYGEIVGRSAAEAQQHDAL